MGRSRSSRRVIPPPSATRTRNMLKKVKNFRKPTNCHRALVAIGSLANLDGASFYINEDDMKVKVNSHSTRNNEVLSKQTNRFLDHALLKCRKLGLIKYETGGDSFKLTVAGKELFRQVKEAVRDLEFATNIEVHRATCEALRRLLPNGSSPTLKELDVENREFLQELDEYKARFGELSPEGVRVDSVISNSNREADEGVFPDNLPSTPAIPRASQNILAGYPTPESIPRPSLSMRYVVTPALASTATQNDDDTMVVDEPQGPANGELGLDERTDELNLKNRELEKNLSSLAAEFSCVVRKYRMKEKEIQALLQKRTKRWALKATIQAEKKKLNLFLIIHRRLRMISNVFQRRIDNKSASIRKLEQDLDAANASILALNDAHFQDIFAA
ncbi:hypothetical protein K443DRAFT_84193 [Laccaria amethystina LaAM-08-1]|uniref:Uncharacterized protein n=1 Tax=Laccaria amethystina LaAM-08-1 TaxID=1095629 RepID=A0A0C9X9D8_9AGAR|nr:hypothetical protein K443DRAFT_84193 [Laccaria amethystina LaAM-08-1]